MVLNHMTTLSFFVRNQNWTVRRSSVLTPCLVSGHALQVKDLSGYKLSGLAGCLLLCFLSGMPATNGIYLGICDMDYDRNDGNSNANTPGLIVDNVGCHEELRIRLLIRYFGTLDHA